MTSPALARLETGGVLRPGAPTVSPPLVPPSSPFLPWQLEKDVADKEELFARTKEEMGYFKRELLSRDGDGSNGGNSGNGGGGGGAWAAGGRPPPGACASDQAQGWAVRRCQDTALTSDPDPYLDSDPYPRYGSCPERDIHPQRHTHHHHRR